MTRKGRSLADPLAYDRDPFGESNCSVPIFARLGHVESMPFEEMGGSGTGRAGNSRRGSAFGLQARSTCQQDDGFAATGHRATTRETLMGASFSVTGKEDRLGGTLGTWGRAGETSFSGSEGTLALEGQVATALVGVDYALNGWLGGLLFSRTDAAGGYEDPSAGSGTLDVSMDAATAFANKALGEAHELWAATGVGRGQLTLRASGGLGQAVPGQNGADVRGGAPNEATVTGEHASLAVADIDWNMAAFGGRSELLDATSSGLSLALVSDAMWARTTSDAAKLGSLVATEADVSRLRLGFEGSLPLDFRIGAITPTVELGLRHDGGDAETGMGVEMGGGIEWHLSEVGLMLDLKGRTLLAHEDDDYEDLGVSVGIVFNPATESDEGLSLSLRRELGSATGGVDALFSPESLSNRMGAGMTTGPSWSAETGWGFLLFNGRFTGTPELRVGLLDGGRDYSIGWRLAPAKPEARELNFGFEFGRNEYSDTETAPDHRVQIELEMLW